MMRNKLLVERLTGLACAEMRVIAACDRALAALREPRARAEVEQLRAERVRHREAWEQLLFNHGGRKPCPRASWRALLLAGAAVSFGLAGPAATLLVLAGATAALSRIYRARPLANLPADARAVARRAQADAERTAEALWGAVRGRWQVGRVSA